MSLPIYLRWDISYEQYRPTNGNLFGSQLMVHCDCLLIHDLEIGLLLLTYVLTKTRGPRATAYS